jgi:hypothetical protein
LIGQKSFKEDTDMDSRKVALNYLSKIVLDFPARMRLVDEHEKLAENLKHLEKRYNIDKVSDPEQAQEVKKEIEVAQNKIKEILEKLSF